MNQPGGTSFSVISQQETARPAANGQIVRGMLISFRTHSGQTGSVFVEEQNYTVDYVRAAILARAQQMDSIAGLTG